MRLLAALAVATVVPVIAPTGEPTSAVLRRLKWPTTKRAGAASSAPPAIPIGATMNVAAAIAAGAMMAAAGAVCSSGRRHHGTLERDRGSSSSVAPRPGHVDHVIVCSSESESSDGWESSACVLESGDELHEVEVDLPVASRKKKASTGKLWSNAQFPEGHVDAANWDLENLKAAQAWSCPCVDRRNCIGQDRVSIIDLYEHRKAFRTTAAAHGGFRDAVRKDLEAHYNDDTRQFMRSFKVGAHTDCCAASSGLAKGISFATWSAARADCKKKRPLHEGRKRARQVTISKERAHLEAYIRALRGEMEGPKGGFQEHDKWRTGKLPISKRWEEYTKRRLQKKLPVIGSEKLFTRVWKEHEEIHEFSAKGHSTCDWCVYSFDITLKSASQNIACCLS